MVFIAFTACTAIYGCARSHYAVDPTETRALAYFKSVYQAFEVLEASRIPSTTLNDKQALRVQVEAMSADFRKFVGEKFRFVNVDKSAIRDCEFLVKGEAQLWAYWAYCQINMNNLTDWQKKDLAACQWGNRELTQDEKELFGNMPWIRLDPKKWTNKDKVFLMGQKACP